MVPTNSAFFLFLTFEHLVKIIRRPEQICETFDMFGAELNKALQQYAFLFIFLCLLSNSYNA